jgi:hypothetical protein
MAPPGLGGVVLTLLLLPQLVASLSPSDTAWLLNATTQLVRGCEQTAFDGTVLFTPDASASYGAQWTRDFCYAVANAPEAFRALGVDPGAAVAFTLSRIVPTGMSPDRVYADGSTVFAPGGPGSWPIKLAWDNHPFAALLLAAYARSWPANATAFACAWEPTARLAFDFVALSPDGLATNDPAAPNCSYGFIDSVVLTGRMFFVSLLRYDAAVQLAALSASTGCGDAAHYSAAAAQVAAGMPRFLDPAGGPLFLAADGLVDALPDVWGSAYAVYLNLTSQAQGQAVADFLAAQWAAWEGGNASTVWQDGQLRHLPYPLVWQRCWTGCPAFGTYQNGAYWATPLRWVAPVLARFGHGDVADAVLNATVASFQQRGVMECINGAAYAGVRDYVASATNVWGAVGEVAAIRGRG